MAWRRMLLIAGVIQICRSALDLGAPNARTERRQIRAARRAISAHMCSWSSTHRTPVRTRPGPTLDVLLSAFQQRPSATNRRLVSSLVTSTAFEVTQARWDGIWILQRYGRGRDLRACTASTLLDAGSRSVPRSGWTTTRQSRRALGQRVGLAPNAARTTSAVFSATPGSSGCPHTTARMKSGPTSRS